MRKAQLIWCLTLFSTLVYLGCASNDNKNGNGNSAPQTAAATPSATASAAATLEQTKDCPGPVHQDVLKDAQQRGYLIMGVQGSAPPMNFSVNADAWEERCPDTEKPKCASEDRQSQELNWRRKGLDYGIASLIAKEMGVKQVKAREVSDFKDLFCLLNRKETDGQFSVDVIMSGIVPDESYNKTIDWSKGYFDFGYSLVTKGNSPIKSLADCKGKKVGVVAGDTFVKKFVQDELGAAPVELSDDDDAWLYDSLDGKVDAIVYDFPFAVEEVNAINAEKKGALLIKEPRIKGTERAYSIGVPKGNPELLAQINAAIDKILTPPATAYGNLARKHIDARKAVAVVDITPQEGEKVYGIKSGDTLSVIAAKELNDPAQWKKIAERNAIGNEFLIYAGQKIVIPKV